MPESKPAELWSYAELEKVTGIPRGTLRVWANRGKLPEPDFRIGLQPAWLPDTIRPWIAEHKRTNDQ